MKAMIFPGQGIQKQGMGRDLYAAFESARWIFDTADQISGQKLLHAMFDGQEKEGSMRSLQYSFIRLHWLQRKIALCQT